LCTGEGVAGNQCRSLLRPLSVFGQPHATGYQGLNESISLEFRNSKLI